MFPGCCGGAVIHGFQATGNRLNLDDSHPIRQKPDDESNDDWAERAGAWLRNEIETRKKNDIANGRKSNLVPWTVGFYQAVLNADQVKFFHDILIDIGFRVVASEVENYRYGSKMTLYLYVVHSENMG